jgi:hypothetical protein
MSLKSPRASKRMWLGIWTGSRISARSRKEWSFDAGTKSPHSFSWRDGLRLRIHPSWVWPYVWAGIMSRAGVSLAMSTQPSGYHLTRPFSMGSRRPRSLFSLTWSFSPFKPSKHMSDKIGKPGVDLTASCCCRADRLGDRRGAVSKCVLGRTWVSSRKPRATEVTEFWRFVQSI